MFKDHSKKINDMLSRSQDKDTLKGSLTIHRIMLKRIQHERLIHLLVTIFVGISMVIVSLTTIVTRSVYLVYLTIPLILLFLGYIIHYKFLENTTQKWYEVEDSIENKIRG